METILRDKKATPETALAFFDGLEPASCEFMIGRWKGFEIKTGHSMEGLLTLSGWYGKQFVDEETVFPLVMHDASKKALYAINPRWIPLQIPLPRTKLIGVLMGLLRPVLTTRTSSARLRLMQYRNKLTATMCYDARAIFDHFAVIDSDTVLGVMDLKGDDQPYIFGLQRDDNSPYTLRF